MSQNVEFEQDGDKVVITVHNIAMKGNLSSTMRTFLVANGQKPFLASNGEKVTVGINAYVRNPDFKG